jgi:hypothetical protein
MATIKPPVDAKPYEPMIKEADSWNLELGSCSATPFSIELDATTKLPVSSDAAEQKFYATYFLGKEHLNFVGMSDSGKFMSISLIKDDTHYRAIVRSATGEEKVSMPSNMVKTSASSSSLFKNTPKQVLKAMFPQIKFKSLKAVKDDKHSSDLRLYECNEHHVSFKWGVLYCAKGQTDENDMFQNQETSKHFDEFLANLGETVELLGWKNYTGGLDTTSAFIHFGAQSLFFFFFSFFPNAKSSIECVYRECYWYSLCLHEAPRFRDYVSRLHYDSLHSWL